MDICWLGRTPCPMTPSSNWGWTWIMVQAPPKRKKSIPGASPSQEEERKDFFCERDGVRYAGTHLIIDLVRAERLDDLEHIEAYAQTMCGDRGRNAPAHPSAPLHAEWRRVGRRRACRSRTSRSIAGRNTAMPRSISSCAARPTRERAIDVLKRRSRLARWWSKSRCAARKSKDGTVGRRDAAP